MPLTLFFRILSPYGGKLVILRRLLNPMCAPAAAASVALQEIIVEMCESVAALTSIHAVFDLSYPYHFFDASCTPILLSKNVSTM